MGYFFDDHCAKLDFQGSKMAETTKPFLTQIEPSMKVGKFLSYLQKRVDPGTIITDIVHEGAVLDHSCRLNELITMTNSKVYPNKFTLICVDADQVESSISPNSGSMIQERVLSEVDRENGMNACWECADAILQNKTLSQACWNLIRSTNRADPSSS